MAFIKYGNTKTITTIDKQAIYDAMPDTITLSVSFDTTIYRPYGASTSDNTITKANGSISALPSMDRIFHYIQQSGLLPVQKNKSGSEVGSFSGSGTRVYVKVKDF